MKRRTLMQLSLGLGAGLATAGVIGTSATRVAAGLPWASRTLNAMGTSMTFKVAHADETLADRALDAAVADIRHIEDQMSLFRPDSAISALNRTGTLYKAHPDMLSILRTAQQVSSRSQGAFDVTVQPLWQAFDAARLQGRLPTAREIAAARQRVNWRGVELSGDSVRLQQKDMAITLNGIAQGFAADKVKARLLSMGIAHALIDAGEWAALGQPAHAGDWTLGVANPRDPQGVIAAIALQGSCMATSADDQCTFSPDFANHHIFDPGTGRSPPELSGVSVLAPTCVLADALTKVFFMAGYDRALPLAKAWGVDVLVVDKQGRWQASPGVVLQRA
jgi:FAD:protein FMN transferase